MNQILELLPKILFVVVVVGGLVAVIIYRVKIQTFLSEVMAEMKKVSWTTRQELIDSTLIVISSAVLLGVFICLIDMVYSRGVTVLLK